MFYFRLEGNELEKSQKQSKPEKVAPPIKMPKTSKIDAELFVVGNTLSLPFTKKNKSLKKIGFMKGDGGMGGAGMGPAMSEGNPSHGGSLVFPQMGSIKKRKLINRRR